MTSFCLPGGGGVENTQNYVRTKWMTPFRKAHFLNFGTVFLTGYSTCKSKPLTEYSKDDFWMIISIGTDSTTYGQFQVCVG